MKTKKTYWTRLFQITRQEWARNNPDRLQCLQENSVWITIYNQATFSEGRIKRFTCANCKEVFSKSEIQCDHRQPISKTVIDTFEGYIENVTKLHSKDLQLLCLVCHKVKTKQEAFNKVFDKTIKRVAKFLDLETVFVKYNLKWEEILTFDKLIKKIESSPDNQKLQKKLDGLKEKFL